MRRSARLGSLDHELRLHSTWSTWIRLVASNCSTNYLEPSLWDYDDLNKRSSQQKGDLNKRWWKVNRTSGARKKPLNLEVWNQFANVWNVLNLATDDLEGWTLENWRVEYWSLQFREARQIIESIRNRRVKHLLIPGELVRRLESILRVSRAS